MVNMESKIIEIVDITKTIYIVFLVYKPDLCWCTAGAKISKRAICSGLMTNIYHILIYANYER